MDYIEPPLFRFHWEGETPDEVLDDIIDRLVVDHRADAIITHNDFVASALLKRLRKRGVRVPEDVAVVGAEGPRPDPREHPVGQLAVLLDLAVGGEVDRDDVGWRVELRRHDRRQADGPGADALLDHTLPHIPFFYGGPGSIPTIPYWEVLRDPENHSLDR